MENSSVSLIKKRARQILYKNWLTHIAAFFVFSVCVTAGYSAAASLLIIVGQYITDTLFSVFSAAITLLMVSVAIPLVYGMFVFEYGAVCKNEADIRNVFYSFGNSYLYRRSVLMFWGLFWRFILIFSPYILLYYEFMAYSTEEESIFYSFAYKGYDVTYFLLVCLLTVLFVLCTGIYSRYVTAIMLAVENEDIPIRLCFSLAGVYNHGRTSKFFLVIASFVPLFVISLLSFGILFFIYSVPVIVLSCFILASDCVKQNNWCKELYNNIS